MPFQVSRRGEHNEWRVTTPTGQIEITSEVAARKVAAFPETEDRKTLLAIRDILVSRSGQAAKELMVAAVEKAGRANT